MVGYKSSLAGIPSLFVSKINTMIKKIHYPATLRTDLYLMGYLHQGTREQCQKRLITIVLTCTR